MGMRRPPPPMTGGRDGGPHQCLSSRVGSLHATSAIRFKLTCAHSGDALHYHHASGQEPCGALRLWRQHPGDCIRRATVPNLWRDD